MKVSDECLHLTLHTNKIYSPVLYLPIMGGILFWFRL